MKSLYKILGLVLICLSLSVVYSYADSVYGTMWKQEDTIVYPADDVTKIDFNNISGLNLLGAGGGVTEGSDVSFSNMTVVGNLVVRQPGGVAGTDEGVINHNGSLFTIESKDGNLRATMPASSFFVPDRVSLVGWWSQTSGASGGINLGSGHNIAWSSNSTNILASGTSGDTGLARDSAGVLRVSDGSTGVGGIISSGQYTAFRNLSSATETLTSADYFINCLANDNEVIITMPPIDASYSQTLMFKYTDSGSTNKCKLDGNGAEQVEGFDVYSGLTTYKDSVIVKSDGSAWWITGGI